MIAIYDNELSTQYASNSLFHFIASILVDSVGDMYAGKLKNLTRVYNIAM